MERIQHNRRKLFLAMAGACSASLLGCANAPITGRKQFMIMPESEEMQMGLLAFNQIRGQEKISKNAKYNELVRKVGSRIATVSGKNYQWEFLCFESEDVNAFCLPGGKIGVYTGILPITQTEAGLAAVMGHEVGHALARHGAERYSTEFATKGIMTGLAIALGRKGGSPESNNEIMAAVGLGAQVGVLLPFSREHELEADHIGTVLMAKAGYNPREAVELWKRMKAKGGNKPPEALSTHPADDNRIRNLESIMPNALKYYKS